MELVIIIKVKDLCYYSGVVVRLSLLEINVSQCGVLLRET